MSKRQAGVVTMATLALIFAGALPAAYGEWLRVDFGVGDGDNQSGFEVFEEGTVNCDWSSNPEVRSFTNSLGASGNVTVKVRVPSGELGKARDRGDVAYTEPGAGGRNLDNLLEDFVAGDFDEGKSGDLTLTLHDLKAGLYTITTYHHDGLDTSYFCHGPFDIKITDADRIGVEIVSDVLNTADQATLFDRRDSPNDSVADPTTATFNFRANGTDDVDIFFDYETPEKFHMVVLNGFELMIPEPSSWILLVTGGLSLLLWCRRRKRN